MCRPDLYFYFILVTVILVILDFNYTTILFNVTDACKVS